MKQASLFALIVGFLLIGTSAQSETLHQRAHAHNDYEHARPLMDALDNRFYSVESDIWLVEGEITVAHNRGDWRGSLKELYLEPLKKRIKENKGSVHGDSLPFYLWMDIKDKRPELRSVLQDLLKQYPMLSVFSNTKGEEMKPGPVTVILTGDATSKRAYIDEHTIRYACRGSNYYSVDDPQGDKKWMWFALNWNNYIKWKGTDPIDPVELKKLKTIVDDIHSKDRRVRFYATPETELYWKTAVEVGIDLINTDHLVHLKTFLEKQK